MRVVNNFRNMKTRRERKFSVIFLPILAIVSFLILACGPKIAPPLAGTSPAPIRTGEVVSTKQGWETQWEKTLEAARKEGTVSVYASLLGPPLRGAVPVFKQKYGIDMEITTGRGSDMSQKFVRERAAGIFIADTFISGLNTFFGVAKKVGGTESMPPALILPEVRDPKLYYTVNELPWADEDKHIFSFFAYPNSDIHLNTDFIKPANIQSWRDLLDPRYKGKIIWSDPSVAGSGLNGFATLIYHKVLDLDFYREIASKQDIMVTRDLRLQVDWLARGKAWIAISAEGTPVAEFVKAGAPLDVASPKEGTYLSVDAGNITIVKNAPHPNAAKIFTNWILSKEGQIFLQNAVGYMSARVDIPTEGVNPKNLRIPGEKYFIGANSIEKWVLEEQENYVGWAKEIFGPLVGR